MRNRFVACNVVEFWTASASYRNIELAKRGHRARPKSYVSTREAENLLKSDLAAAATRARQAVESNPGDPLAHYVLGAVLRKDGRWEEARQVLEPLSASQPHIQPVWHELGLTLARLDCPAEATAALLRATDLAYMDEDAWYALGDLLFLPDQVLAEADASGGDRPDARLAEAKRFLNSEQFEAAEKLLRQTIDDDPDDVQALKLLGDALLRSGRWNDAKPLFERALELAPDFLAARFRLATMLFVYSEFLVALPHIEELRKSDPASIPYRGLKALALSWSRQFDVAAAEFETFIEQCHSEAGLWLEYARLLRVLRSKNAEAAYRQAIRILPSYVEAYSALATVKTVRLDTFVVDDVRAQLARPELGPEDCAQLHYFLGKAFEDWGQYEESFRHYRQSNEILVGARDYGAEASTGSLQRSKAFFKPAWFREHLGVGCPEKGAIFVVGMPRAGSTLVEQILSSHSEIEALGELWDLPDVVSELTRHEGNSSIPFPYTLSDLDPDRFRLVGEAYMARTRRRRKLGKPFFVDKLPANHTLVALIHLILPNARIVDARRHPLDCGLSCYKHYFPRGQPITLDLRDIGRGYANYVELMAHFDQVLPGVVHRVIYERLIANFEPEVRRLLKYVGVPFEEQCLRFHENKRLVLTLSADQVGMPLYKTAIEHWRHYEPWLGPLKEELGYVLDIYPEVPKYYAEVHARLSKPLSLGFGANLFGVIKGIRQPPFWVPTQNAAQAAA